MDEDREPGVSLLSRTVNHQGALLHIEIYEDGEGRWLLAVTNDDRVTNHWTESFATDREALEEAMKAIKEEGVDGFSMETMYKDLHQ
jgi:hypothetical protein